MRSLERVKRLERAERARPCPACRRATKLVAVQAPPVKSLREVPPVAERPGDRCARCNRQLVFRLAVPGHGYGLTTKA